MHRVATTPWSDDPRDRQDPAPDAAQRDRRSMHWVGGNVVIRCILHDVRNLSLRDPTVGAIDEQMLAVVLVPNGVASRIHEFLVYTYGIYAWDETADPGPGARVRLCV